MAEKTEIEIVASDKSTSVINFIGNRLQWLSKPAGAVGAATRNLALVAGAGATAITGAATATFLFGKKSADAADEIGDLAARYGQASQDIQVYGAALKEGGGTTEDAAQSLGKFSRNITEAIYKGGEMREVFAGAGVTLKDLQTLSKPEIIEKMADAFSHSTDEGKKGLILTKAFGKTGTIWADTLNKGGEALRQRRKEMAADGRLYNDQEIENADAFDKSYQRLTGTIEGVQKSLGSKLYPALTPIINQFQQWIVANKGVIESRIDEFLVKLPGLLDQGVIALKELAKITGNVLTMFKGVYNVLGPTGTAVLGLTVALAPTILATGQLAVSLGQVILWAGRASGVFTFLTTTVKALWVIIQVHPFVALGVAVVYVATLIYKNWDGIVLYTSQAWERIKAMFNVSFFDGIIQAWIESWQALGNAILGVLRSILPESVMPEAVKNFQFDYGNNRVAKTNPALIAAQKSEVGGLIKIQVDSKGQAKVTEVKSNNPGMDFDVTAGLIMSGS